jgi:hypothetical protein
VCSGNYARLATVKAPTTLPTSEITDASWRMGHRCVSSSLTATLLSGQICARCGLVRAEMIDEASTGCEVVAEMQSAVVVLGLGLPDILRRECAPVRQECRRDWDHAGDRSVCSGAAIFGSAIARLVLALSPVAAGWCGNVTSKTSRTGRSKPDRRP